MKYCINNKKIIKDKLLKQINKLNILYINIYNNQKYYSINYALFILFRVAAKAAQTLRVLSLFE